MAINGKIAKVIAALNGEAIVEPVIATPILIPILILLSQAIPQNRVIRNI